MTGGVEMTFELIDMEQWPRREHYRYYMNRSAPVMR